MMFAAVTTPVCVNCTNLVTYDSCCSCRARWMWWHCVTVLSTATHARLCPRKGGRREERETCSPSLFDCISCFECISCAPSTCQPLQVNGDAFLTLAITLRERARAHTDRQTHTHLFQLIFLFSLANSKINNVVHLLPPFGLSRLPSRTWPSSVRSVSSRRSCRSGLRRMLLRTSTQCRKAPSTHS